MELITLLILLLTPYAFVGLVIFIMAHRLRNHKDYHHNPTVTIFLPTFNEVNYIAGKLDNLLSQTYPIKEILIFDCSTDGTDQIVEQYKKKFPSITLIRQPERIGNARTFNEALKLASGELFVRTDSDSISEPNALKEIVSNFADKNVGAATGILPADKGVEKLFRQVMTTIQIAESNIDSTLIAHAASFLTFRTSLLEPVKEDSFAEDTEEFLLIRKKGYKTIVDPTSISREEVPADYAVRRKQKSRRAQGIVEVLLDNFHMLLNPKYGKYGALVLPIEWFILIFSPVLLILFVAILTYTAYLVHPLFSVAIITIIGIAVIHRSNILYTIMDTQLSGLVGLAKSLGRRNSDTLWEKVR